MLRIIVRETDCGAACNVGGPVNSSWKSFDVELPEVESFLSEKRQYMTREVVGVEIAETGHAAPWADLLVGECDRSALSIRAQKGLYRLIQEKPGLRLSFLTFSNLQDESPRNTGPFTWNEIAEWARTYPRPIESPAPPAE